MVALMAPTLNAQTVSPYFQDPWEAPGKNDYETQMTFFDLAFVSVYLDKYMDIYLSMYNDNNDLDVDKIGTGSFTTNYRSSASKESFMDVRYELFSVSEYYVVKKVTIKGSKDVLSKFYDGYWSNSQASKTHTLKQDKITYRQSATVGTIEIVNTKFKGKADFMEHLSQVIDEKEAREQAEAKAEEARQAQAKAEAQAQAAERRKQEAIERKKREEAAAAERQRRAEEEKRKEERSMRFLGSSPHVL